MAVQVMENGMGKARGEDSGDDPGIEVKSIGLRWYHPAGFLVDRPHGSKDYAFMQWLTPAKIRLNGKTEIHPPGGCIVFGPDDPQWFGGDVFSPFGNNWFHFQGCDAASVLRECRIPVNRALRLRDTRFIEPLLTLCQRESLNKPPLWRCMQASHVWRFFVELSRSLAGGTVRRKSSRSAGWRASFEELRAEVKARCGEVWTVGRMAETVHLSPSRFTDLYREFFGVAPTDDLINMRVALAEYYLSMTNAPVSDIADACGFSGVQYFSRQFKGRTGETPSTYRLMHGDAAE